MEEKTIKKVSLVIDYIAITPKVSLITNNSDIQDFKKLVALEFQGEAVEIADNLNLKLYPITLSALFSCAKELVIKLHDNRKILIFSHIDEELYIRPENINLKIWDEICKLRSLNTQKERNKKINIDLNKIWESNKNVDIVLETIIFLKQLSKELVYSEEIEIVGEIPALPTLATIYFIRPYGKKIYFTYNKEKINLF